MEDPNLKQLRLACLGGPQTPSSGVKALELSGAGPGQDTRTTLLLMRGLRWA